VTYDPGAARNRLWTHPLTQASVRARATVVKAVCVSHARGPPVGPMFSFPS
jgi:hypothetical protein